MDASSCTAQGAIEPHVPWCNLFVTLFEGLARIKADAGSLRDEVACDATTRYWHASLRLFDVLIELDRCLLTQIQKLAEQLSPSAQADLKLSSSDRQLLGCLCPTLLRNEVDYQKRKTDKFLDELRLVTDPIDLDDWEDAVFNFFARIQQAQAEAIEELCNSRVLRGFARDWKAELDLEITAAANSWEGDKWRWRRLYCALQEGWPAEVQDLLEKLLWNYVPIHDRKPDEHDYHKHLHDNLGWLAGPQNMEREKEAGGGRFDLRFKPRHHTFPAVLMEFKVAQGMSEQRLQKALDDAEQQLDDEDYAFDFRAENLNNILQYAIAIKKHKVRVRQVKPRSPTRPEL